MGSPDPSPAAATAAAERIRRLSSSLSDDRGSASPPSSSKAVAPSKTKRVLVVRHGEAAHNPRAEAARKNGCSMEEFLKITNEDDVLDSELTELGVSQGTNTGQLAHVRHALSNVELVVSSPLSRALRTADLVHPPSNATEHATGLAPRRVCKEDFREHHGHFLCTKRLPRSTLEDKFQSWDFSEIPATEESWTEKFESRDSCSARGYQSLLWLLNQRENSVLLVCHGSLLNLVMNKHEKVVLVDGREGSEQEGQLRCVTKSFDNCEMREFIATVWDSTLEQPVVTLEEVAMETETVGEK
ncbi:hypothetical protein ACHAWF_007200 [Thalassiosira exigua]